MDSELRQDIVSGDWIIMSPGRAKRPEDFVKRLARVKRVRPPVKSCNFENPQKYGNVPPIFIYRNKDDWSLQIIPNKYPAVSHEKIIAVLAQHGPYSVLPGVGHHDLIITRNHDNNFPKLDRADARLVFRAFRDRYLMLLSDKYLAYVSMFHNWGPLAGASLYHPHYQMIAIPVVPPDIKHSLAGAGDYFRAYKKCVHCVMIEWELKEKKRLVYQNKGAVAFAPFVSREPFEMRIFPKRHLPYFENTLDDDLWDVVDCLQRALKKVEKNLGSPDYNFFIHTAPIEQKKSYVHYHWHIEIRPKISIAAGFELGTGVEINVIDPDHAAKLLRK